MKRTLLVIACAWTATTAQVRISQVYGGGGNSGATYTNDFIEIFNAGRQPAALNGWSVQYSSSTGTSWQKTDIPSVTLQPGQYYLIQEAAGAGGTTRLPSPDVADGAIPMSSSAGKVVLVSNQNAIANVSCPGLEAGIADLVGYGTGTNCFEGSAVAPTLSNTTAAVRIAGGCRDTGDNSSDFQAAAPAPRNTQSPASVCATGTGPSATGTASPNPVAAGSIVALKVTVTPGADPVSEAIRVTCDLSRLGGPAAVALAESSGAYGVQFTVPILTAAGNLALACQVSDAQLRVAPFTIALTVAAPVASPARISEVNGSGTRSPKALTAVTVRGIVTALRAPTGSARGFYIQSVPGDQDSDPATSEGLLIFTGSANPPECAVVGNTVEVSGIVQDFVSSAAPVGSVPLTELSNTSACTVVSTGAAPPAPVTPSIDPKGDANQARRWLGMRVAVASAVAVAPSLGALDEATALAAPSGTFFVSLAGSQRPARGAGILATRRPAEADAAVSSWNGAPEILRVNTSALAGGAAYEVAAGATVANLTGVMDFNTSEGQYQIYAGALTPAPQKPAISAVAVQPPLAHDLAIANFNIARFFDDREQGNGAGAILTADAYRGRLRKLSLAIRNVLRSPDIVGFEEVESPRFGIVPPSYPVIQDIANQLNADAAADGQPNPNYSWCMAPTNDPGAIGVAFLYKKDRLASVECTQYGATTLYTEPGNTRALLNDRPPLVLTANMNEFPLRVVLNHLRSLSGFDQPGIENGERVRSKRNEQAKYLQALINGKLAEQTTNWALSGNLVVIGDFNAYSANDGYVDVMGCITGQPAPAGQQYFTPAQLAAGAPCGAATTLYEVFDSYSYTFGGVSNTLDHVLVNQGLKKRVRNLMVAHSNADFPEGPTYRNDTTRPERVSDHDMPVLYLALPHALEHRR